MYENLLGDNPMHWGLDGLSTDSSPPGSRACEAKSGTIRISRLPPTVLSISRYPSLSSRK